MLWPTHPNKFLQLFVYIFPPAPPGGLACESLSFCISLISYWCCCGPSCQMPTEAPRGISPQPSANAWVRWGEKPSTVGPEKEVRPKRRFGPPRMILEK